MNLKVLDLNGRPDEMEPELRPATLNWSPSRESHCPAGLGQGHVKIYLPGAGQALEAVW